MPNKNNICIVFDLDDTLYKEVDFLRSAYQEIALYIERLTSRKGIYELMLQGYVDKINVFQMLEDLTNHQVTKEQLLLLYRNHKPNISLNKGTIECLDKIKKANCVIGIITDGRSITQRNKIIALNLSHWIDNENIIISEEFGSEKPSEENYLYFEDKYPDMNYFYIGDNVKKDFISPNKLNWCSICLLDDGQNIHKQSENVAIDSLPHYYVSNLNEVLKILYI